jgi:hypothetical protein
MSKRAGTMPQNEGKSGPGLSGGKNLGGEISQLIETRRIWQSLVGNQRPAQFKKDKFIHIDIFAQNTVTRNAETFML